jgi:hypothetical protein
MTGEKYCIDCGCPVVCPDTEGPVCELCQAERARAADQDPAADESPPPW